MSAWEPTEIERLFDLMDRLLKEVEARARLEGILNEKDETIRTLQERIRELDVILDTITPTN